MYFNANYTLLVNLQGHHKQCGNVVKKINFRIKLREQVK